VRCDASDSSRSYGRVAQRARCGFSGETHTGRAFAGPPPCLGSLIWNDQTSLAQAKPETPAKAPSRPRRLVQRFLKCDLSIGCPHRQLDIWWPAASGVVRWLQGAGFCLYQNLKLLHWVRPDPSRRHRFIRSRESRNTVTTGPVGRGGLAGARKRLTCQQHISDSTKFSGSPEAGPSLPLPIRWHLAP